jgi:DNA-directed RNA polymerase subunit RPC12/RpoP
MKKRAEICPRCKIGFLVLISESPNLQCSYCHSVYALDEVKKMT